MTALAAIDHLVFFAPHLEAGAGHLERVLGVRPERGGQHIGLGTHNALVSFGDSYLELIAPDPDQPDPSGPRPFGIDELNTPQLVTFAVRPAPGHTMAELIAAAVEAEHDPGEAVSMSRLRPDGVELRWSLTFPSGRADGLIPFFIDWGDTPNPAASAPVGPALVALHGSTADPRSANTMLDALGLPSFAVPLDSQRPGLHATLANHVDL